MKILPQIVIAALLPSCFANALDKKQWSSWQQTTAYWTPATTQYWTPASTQYWTPTASYQSVWVGTSTSTVYMYITQQANVVVTMTSYIPCVVTSTTWVYQCQGGCPTSAQAPVGVGGTVTVTSYAQVTGSVQVTTRTVTSGSYVLAIVEAVSATASVSTARPGNMASSVSGPISLLLPILVAVSVFWLMICL